VHAGAESEVVRDLLAFPARGAVAGQPELPVEVATLSRTTVCGPAL